MTNPCLSLCNIVRCTVYMHFPFCAPSRPPCAVFSAFDIQRSSSIFVFCSLFSSCLQVSQLVLLHDASADGSAMPDLSTQIMAVNAAVQNLVRVGKDTTASSKDEILKQDMPPAFTEVEQASNSLVEASQIFKTDPHSKAGRKILIEGSRG